MADWPHPQWTPEQEQHFIAWQRQQQEHGQLQSMIDWQHQQLIQQQWQQQQDMAAAMQQHWNQPQQQQKGQQEGQGGRGRNRKGRGWEGEGNTGRGGRGRGGRGSGSSMPDFSPNPSNKSRSPFEGQHHAIRLPEGPPGDMQIPGPSQMDTSQLEASGYVVVTPKHISPIPSQENSLAPSVTSEPGDRDPEEEKERQRINAGIQELDKIREAREVQQQVNAGAERIATIIKVLQTRGGPQAHTAKFWIEQNQQGKFEERFEAEEEEQKQKDKIETVRETLKTRLGTFSEGKACTTCWNKR